MLHSWYSCAGPWQVCPPYLGSGLVQVLLRLRIPRLQSLLHCDQEVQDDQPPFTVFPEILPRRRTSPVWEECWEGHTVVNAFRVKCHIAVFLSAQGCCINKVELNYVHLFWRQHNSEVLAFHFSSINVEGVLSSFLFKILLLLQHSNSTDSIQIELWNSQSVHYRESSGVEQSLIT